MRRIRWWLAAALVLICIPGLALGFPKQWPAGEGGNDHYYFVYVGEISWTDADDAAQTLVWQGLTGYLATITSPEEQAWILENMVTMGDTWIGGYQVQGAEEPDGGWRWVTDEAWQYTNWADGQPDNDAEANRLVYMPEMDGMWADVPADLLMNYTLIEFDDDAVATEVTSFSAVKALYR